MKNNNTYIASFNKDNNKLLIDDNEFSSEGTKFLGNQGATSEGLIVISTDKQSVYLPNKTPDLQAILSLQNELANQVKALADSVPVPNVPLNPVVSTNITVLLQDINKVIEELK